MRRQRINLRACPQFNGRGGGGIYGNYGHGYGNDVWSYGRAYGSYGHNYGNDVWSCGRAYGNYGHSH